MRQNFYLGEGVKLLSGSWGEGGFAVQESSSGENGTLGILSLRGGTNNLGGHHEVTTIRPSAQKTPT